MNFGIIRRVLGGLLIVEAVLLLPAMLVSLYYGDQSWQALGISAIMAALVGVIFVLSSEKFSNTIRPRDGLAIVAFGWFFASLFGAMPFYLSGTLTSFVDAFFETVSGFTTTGATVIPDVEIVDKGIIFWRGFTHWVGGMGILVFSLALLPALGVGSFQIYKAESPGPVAGKIAPRIRSTARLLYISYLILTVVQIILLLLGGMTLFEATVHSFSTMGTGGFGIKNDSVASYNDYLQMVLAVFMVLAALNFSMYFLLWKKRFREFFRDNEVQFFGVIISATTLIIMLELILEDRNSLWVSFKNAFFQVTSIISTTGLASTDFNMWPETSQLTLLVLMFIGGCAGSTAGGMKVIRVLVSLKLAKREFSKIAHPRAYAPIKINNKIMSNEVVAGINSFMVLHLSVFVFGVLLISLEGYDHVTSITAVAATLNNVGPGLSLLGPKFNYSFFSDFSKIALSLFMLMGRLELYTVIALLAPKRWLDES